MNDRAQEARARCVVCGAASLADCKGSMDRTFSEPCGPFVTTRNDYAAGYAAALAEVRRVVAGPTMTARWVHGERREVFVNQRDILAALDRMEATDARSRAVPRTPTEGL